MNTDTGHGVEEGAESRSGLWEAGENNFLFRSTRRDQGKKHNNGRAGDIS